MNIQRPTSPLRLLTCLLPAFVMLMLQSLPALSETAEFGDYRVHYNVVNSTFLKPDIAEQYGITRGPRSAFVNVSVQKIQPGGSPEPVTAVISGEKGNLMQQNVSISFNEIREGSAIYYIGEFEFSNAEPVFFRLSVQPEGRGPEYSLEWDTRVYINNTGSRQ